ncbi:hypothetical protein ACVIDN_006873 [Rhizobium brockwellii]
MGDDLDDFRVAVAGIANLGNFRWRDGPPSHCQCPGKFDGSRRLRVVRRATAVSRDLAFVELGKLRAREGVGREAVVTTVCFSHGKRNAFAGGRRQLALAECALERGQARQCGRAIGHQPENVRDGTDLLLDSLQDRAGGFWRIDDGGRGGNA